MRGDVHRLQKIDGGEIERRGEAVEAEGFGELLEAGLPFPGRGGLGVELVQIAPFPEGALADLKERGAQVQGHGVRRVGLELDGVGAGVLGGVHEGGGLGVVLVMVGRHFRDDVGGMAGADGAAVDREGDVHGVEAGAASGVMVTSATRRPSRREERENS